MRVGSRFPLCHNAACFPLARTFLLYQLNQRFRGFYPVIIDIETAGFNASTDAMLQIAAVTLAMDDQGLLSLANSISFDVAPFAGANLNPSSLAFIGIDPHDPARQAVSESEALSAIFKLVREGMKVTNCHRAVMVAHNPAFDNAFLTAATERAKVKRSPFHPFATLDTATMAGLAFGQTVLHKACAAAAIEFDGSKAHNALYDATQTAQLFCHIVNQWQTLAGWPATATGNNGGDS